MKLPTPGRCSENWVILVVPQKIWALRVPRAGRYFIIFSWVSNLRLTTRCYLGRF
jgi:hypothetical protein